MKTLIALFFSLLLLSFVIPFIIQKSVFPFYRYGMFAEPPKENIIQEDFEVLVCKQNQLQDFNPRSKGLYQSVFSYLLRNYYYRNQAEKFLEILANGDSSSSTFYMIRKYNNSNRQAAEKMIIDTVAVYENKHFN